MRILFLSLVISFPIYAHVNFNGNLSCKPFKEVICSLTGADYENACRESEFSHNVNAFKLTRNKSGYIANISPIHGLIDNYNKSRLKKEIQMRLIRPEPNTGEPSDKYFMETQNYFFIDELINFYENNKLSYEEHLSAYAILSAIGHPHTLQIIYGEDGTDTRTNILYSFCNDI